MEFEKPHQWGVSIGPGTYCGGRHLKPLANLGYMPPSQCEAECEKNPQCTAYQFKDRDGSTENYECQLFDAQSFVPKISKDRTNTGECVVSCSKYYDMTMSDRSEFLTSKKPCPPQKPGENCRLQGDCGLMDKQQKGWCANIDKTTLVGHCEGISEMPNTINKPCCRTTEVQKEDAETGTVTTVQEIDTTETRARCCPTQEETQMPVEFMTQKAFNPNPTIRDTNQWQNEARQLSDSAPSCIIV